MTNLDIETFWAVVHHGTMTAAAESLYITQPTLSMRIRALEERVGTPLFVRGKGQRHITLTEAGQKFLTLAQRWQQLLAETDSLAELGQREYLRIAEKGHTPHNLRAAFAMHDTFERKGDMRLTDFGEYIG